MKTYNLPFFFFLFLILFSFSCCNNGKKTDNDDDNKKDSIANDSLNKPTTPDESILTPQCPKSTTFLFDVSHSMKGYMDSEGESRFIGAISFFLNIAEKTNIYLYDTKEGAPIKKDVFDKKLVERDLPWSDESNFKSMVKSMANHIGSKYDASFLITDGILSGSNSDIRNSPGRSYNINHQEKMMNEISNILEKGKGKTSALIIRYKANFNGKYYCYNNDSIPKFNKERPFFVICLGKWSSIKYIENKLKEKQKGIGVQYENLLMIGDTCSYHKMKLSYGEGIKTSEREKGVYIIKKEYRNQEVSLSSDLKNLPEYMQTEEYLNSNIELYVQHGEKAAKPLNKDCYEIAVNKTAEKTILKLSIKAHQLLNSKLTFKLKYALPAWVDMFSDDNDHDIKSNPSKWNKTFNLKYLIRGFSSLNEDYVKEQTLEFK